MESLYPLRWECELRLEYCIMSLRYPQVEYEETLRVFADLGETLRNFENVLDKG